MPEQAPFQVIYEDNHLIVVDKASGVLVQGDSTGDEPLSEMLKEYIRVKYKKPGNVFLGVVHRLDRPVSGLVIFARTSKALERMNKVFKENRIQKIYWALVSERPPEDRQVLLHWLQKDHTKNITKAYEKQRNGTQFAQLEYQLLAKVNKYYLLEIKLGTGRPHQIRAQLAKIGCPIKGDIKYGYGQKNKDGRIHLHARKLEFIHPVKQDPIILSARLPRDQVWGEYKHVGI